MGGAENASDKRTVAVGCDQLPEPFHGKGRPPPRKVRGRLSCSARDAKSCEPEGPNVIPDDELYAQVERFVQVLEVNLLVDLGLDAATIRALHANAHPA